MLNDSMRSLAKSHKAAIVKKLKERQDRKKEEADLKRAREDERRKRREKRAALRERARLNTLKESIMSNMIANTYPEEYNPKLKIYDIRDTNANTDGIILIGGLVGELIITFTCMLDFILADPAN